MRTWRGVVGAGVAVELVITVGAAEVSDGVVGGGVVGGIVVGGGVVGGGVVKAMLGSERR